MDYSHMLHYHEKKGADCTIAVIDVRDEDLYVITEVDDWINDRIKAEHNINFM